MWDNCRVDNCCQHLYFFYMKPNHKTFQRPLQERNRDPTQTVLVMVNFEAIKMLTSTIDSSDNNHCFQNLQHYLHGKYIRRIH